MNNASRKEYCVSFRTRDGQIKNGKRFGISAAQVLYEITNESAIIEVLSCRPAADLAFSEMISAGQSRTWAPNPKKSAWEKQAGS
jgi:hypothetical protein